MSRIPCFWSPTVESSLMPFGWPWLPQDAHDSNRLPQVQANNPNQLPKELVLKKKKGSLLYEAAPDPHYEISNAELTYGETVVKADLIELYPKGDNGGHPGAGMAHGHVQVTDPVGVLSADDASFNW